MYIVSTKILVMLAPIYKPLFPASFIIWYTNFSWLSPPFTWLDNENQIFYVLQCIHSKTYLLWLLVCYPFYLSVLYNVGFQSHLTIFFIMSLHNPTPCLPVFWHKTSLQVHVELYRFYCIFFKIFITNKSLNEVVLLS